MKRLLLIDGNSILFRAYYATAGMGNLMVNKDGIPTNGVYGFIMMINRLLENKPDYIYIAFDAHRKTFRNELMADYKGTRKETPEELVVQFDIVKEYLDAANIPYYQKDGYEADDLIGTMATIAKNHDIDVEIVTGDKDMLQLVDDHITVLRTSKGVTDLNVMTPEAVKEKFGVEPAQIQDLLGLMGDTADNIPGIKGVGEKTAVKLLNSYGSVEGIKEHAGEIKGKMGEKVRENIDTGVLSKQIATILTDVPLDDEDIEHYHYQDYDYDTLSAFFRKYDMNSLLRRISRPDTARETMEFKVVEKVPEIRDHSSLVAVCYDENYHRSIVLGYAIYHPDQSFYIEYEKAIEDEKFKDYLKDKNIHKYGYDMKKCILASRWNQMNIEGFDFDLKLAAYVLDPGIKDEIKDVADYLEYDGQLSYDDEILGKGAKKHIPELSEISKHAILQAKAVYDLHDTILDKIKANGQEELYQLELEVSDILTEMEYTGTKLDVDVLKELEKEFESKAETLEKSIYEDAGVEFNISSPKQLGEVLFE